MNTSGASDAIWSALHEDMRRLFAGGEHSAQPHADPAAAAAPRIWISGREGACAMSRHQFEQWRQGFTTPRR